MTAFPARLLAAAAVLLNARLLVAACPPDSVKVGPTCVDKYEASVWQIDASNTTLIGKVQAGTATLSDLNGGGAIQVSPSSSCSPAFPSTFPATGNWTMPLYAVSVAGVHPTACVTWFQAEQTCALSGQRLVTNQEWQVAAAGTPDPGGTPGSNDCNTNSVGPANTGSRTNCKSNWGAFDMVGNVWEWVADWGDLANACTNWPASFGSDLSCVGGPGSGFSNLPGALIRGGGWDFGAGAGVFAVDALSNPSDSSGGLGFRCAR